MIAAHRDLARVADDSTSLGSVPPREQVLHHALWHRAHAAAGAPTEELDYTTATEVQLRQMRAVYQRQLAWAPPWVHDELRDAQLAAAGYEQDAVLWRAEAQLTAPGSPERVRAEADVHAARQLAQTYQARVAQLRVIDTARREWHHDTEPARTRSEHAGDELARRGLPRDLTTEAPQQLPLFNAAPTSMVSTTGQQITERQNAARAFAGRDHAAQQRPSALTSRAGHSTATSTTGEPAVGARAAATVAHARGQSDVAGVLRARHTGLRAALAQLHQRLVHQPGRDDDTAAYLSRQHDNPELGHTLGHDLGTDRGRDRGEDLDDGVGW